MARFKLDHLEPHGTIEHTMHGIVLAPAADSHAVVLVLKHAGKANERFVKAWKNARAKGNDDDQTAVRIFARTVIEGWRHVYDADGKPVPFSPEDAESLLLELIEAKRNDAVNEALAKAGDANLFTARDDLGKE